jgi:3-hydroxymyristoyl/3-hydroxydecanoyl-(acyl carrier protein) dehydratase
MSGNELGLRFAPDHPALAGHFPGHPIVPGVLLLDAAIHGIGQAVQRPWQIVMVKFHRPVRPDQPLRLDYSPETDGRVRFELHAGQDLAVSGTIAPTRRARPLA